jgi:hypothetical protein
MIACQSASRGPAMRIANGISVITTCAMSQRSRA